MVTRLSQVTDTANMAQAQTIPSPLTLLLEIGEAFHSTLELGPLLEIILQQMQNAACSEGVSVWLLDSANTQLTCTHAVGPQETSLVGKVAPAAGLLATDLLTQDRAILIDNPDQDPEASPYLLGETWRHARNVILALLIVRGELLGTLVVVNKLEAPSFSDADRRLVEAVAGHAAIAIRNAQLYEQQRRGTERQRLLEQISHHMQQTLDIQVLIPLVLEEVNKAIRAEAQSLWLLNEETHLIACHYATGPGGEAIKKVKVPVGKGIVGASIERQEPILLNDAQSDDRVFRAADSQTGFVTRSLICVPMVRQGKAIGAIQAVNKLGSTLFTHDDLELLRSIADSAALAIENARLYAELAASYDSTLDALTAALDLRDRETEGHSRRVVEYTARLARQMGLADRQIADICRGALIHDIGKIGLPDAILHKPGLLDTKERHVMEKHPLAGYEMLLGIPYLHEEIPIVLAHQERWDGTGYPFSLKGYQIPLGARLFAVADTFDALTSDRVYRRSATCEEARQVIAQESGRQFDPVVVKAFLDVPVAEWEAIRSHVFEEVALRRLWLDERVRKSHAELLMNAPTRRPLSRLPGTGPLAGQ
jgi:HD-GYP domain-containing protein (c-di-GMP phosphodiesterase class II)